MGSESNLVERRKRDHLDPFRKGGVEAKSVTTWLEHVHLVHTALPELALDEIELGARFADREFRAPLFVTGMTGGTDEAAQINRDLAAVAGRLGIGFGLGSGRAMLVDAALAATYQVRAAAPNAFIAWNLGGVQLASTPVDRIRVVLDELEADAVCIHLNPAQEMLQPEGDRDFRGILDAVRELVAKLDRPVIVKETGAGISRQVGLRLQSAGVRFVDVAGCGGTSWVGVEIERRGSSGDPEAMAFWDWGIPTAAAVRDLADSGLELIASGGIRTGLDVARAIALGAQLAGLASPVIQAYFRSGVEGAERYLLGVLNTLRTCMLLTGSRDLAALRIAPRSLSGPLAARAGAANGDRVSK